MLATDSAKLLMETAIHALMIMLDFGHPIGATGSRSAGVGAGMHGDSIGASEAKAGQRNAQEPDPLTLPTVNPNDIHSQGFNVFRRILGKIDDPGQLQFMFRGFARLLNSILQNDASYAPFSSSRVLVEQELLVLLWKCLEEVPIHALRFATLRCD